MYIGYIIACWFYNFVIPWTGGVELEVADVISLDDPVKIAPPLEEEIIVPSEPPSSSTHKKEDL